MLICVSFIGVPRGMFDFHPHLFVSPHPHLTVMPVAAVKSTGRLQRSAGERAEPGHPRRQGQKSHAGQALCQEKGEDDEMPVTTGTYAEKKKVRTTRCLSREARTPGNT